MHTVGLILLYALFIFFLGPTVYGLMGGPVPRRTIIGNLALLAALLIAIFQY